MKRLTEPRPEGADGGWVAYVSHESAGREVYV